MFPEDPRLCNMGKREKGEKGKAGPRMGNEEIGDTQDAKKCE
jgi:hypothetical protein